MVPTPPRSVRTVVTDQRMAERVTQGPNKVVMVLRMAERITTGPEKIVTDSRMAEKICMGPRTTSLCAMCRNSTTCLLDHLLL